MCLSTCPLSSSACYHRLSALSRLSPSFSPLLLCPSSPVLNHPPPPVLFAWAAFGEQVNKSLSSSGEDNEATGDTLHSADVCRCFARSHMERGPRHLIYIPPDIRDAPRKTHGLRSDAPNKHRLECVKRNTAPARQRSDWKKTFSRTILPPRSTFFSFMLSEFSTLPPKNYSLSLNRRPGTPTGRLREWWKYAQGEISLSLILHAAGRVDNHQHAQAQLHFPKTKKKETKLWH